MHFTGKSKRGDIDLATSKKRGERKRRGRPPGLGADPSTVRSQRVVVMLTPGDFEKLDRMAMAEGVPVGTKAHSLLVKQLPKR